MGKRAARKKGGRGRALRAAKASEKARLRPLRSARLRDLASGALDERRAEKERSKADQLLLQVPRPSARCEYVSLAGYERHVKKNCYREEHGLEASDAVERSEQDLQEECAARRLQYDDLLTHEVVRFLRANHLDPALEKLALERAASSRALGWPPRVSVDSRPVDMDMDASAEGSEEASPTSADANARTQDPAMECENAVSNGHSTAGLPQAAEPPQQQVIKAEQAGLVIASVAAGEAQAASIAPLLAPAKQETVKEEQEKKEKEDGQTEEDIDRSPEAVDAMWREFEEAGFMVRKRLEFRDPKTKRYYPARVTQIKDDKGAKVHKGIPIDQLDKPAQLLVHCYGFAAKSAEWLRFDNGLRSATLRGETPIRVAPPGVFTDRSGFPRSGRRKKRVTVESSDEEKEENEPEVGASGALNLPEALCSIDCNNIVQGRRKRKATSHYVVELRKKQEEEEKMAEFVAKYSETVCGMCGEAHYGRDLDAEHELYICEGGCNKVYHAPCLGLEKAPAGKLICERCSTNSHNCWLCLEKSEEEDMDHEMTLQCSTYGCGRHFHPSCVRRDERSRIFKDSDAALSDAERNNKQAGNNNKRQKRQSVVADAERDSGSEVASEANSNVEAGADEDEDASESAQGADSDYEDEDGGGSASANGKADSAGDDDDDDDGDDDVAMVTEEKAVRPEKNDAVAPAATSNGTSTMPTAPLEFEFSCPGHCCTTCFNRREEGEGTHPRMFQGKFVFCLGCSRGFHLGCVPYGSLRNALGLLCSECAKEYDAPLCEKDTVFLHQERQRQSMELKIDFARFFQEQAQQLNLEAGEAFRLPPNFLGQAPPKAGASKRRGKGKTPKYTPLRMNQYAKTKPVVNKDTLEQVCQCHSVCDDSCQNRLLRIECCEQNCRARDCHNRQFQRLEYKKVTVFETPGRGFGLALDEAAQAGDFVIEYVGEVISAKEARKRLEKSLQSKERHVFQMDLGNDQIIDARHKGNLARFVNHSCQPNCVLHKWNVRGITRIGIFADRAIAPGEELSFDYSFQKSSELDFECLCGAPDCRGTLNSVTSRDSQAKRDLLAVEKKISTLERWIRQANGGLLKAPSLKRLINTESAEVMEIHQERARRQRRLAINVQRARPARKTLDALSRATRQQYPDLLRAESKPFLVRTLEKGADLVGRARVRNQRRAKRLAERKALKAQKQKLRKQKQAVAAAAASAARSKTAAAAVAAVAEATAAAGTTVAPAGP